MTTTKKPRAKKNTGERIVTVTKVATVTYTATFVIKGKTPSGEELLEMANAAEDAGKLEWDQDEWLEEVDRVDETDVKDERDAKLPRL